MARSDGIKAIVSRRAMIEGLERGGRSGAGATAGVADAQALHQTSKKKPVRGNFTDVDNDQTPAPTAKRGALLITVSGSYFAGTDRHVAGFKIARSGSAELCLAARSANSRTRNRHWRAPNRRQTWRNALSSRKSPIP
jgi:hypothetical protein